MPAVVIVDPDIATNDVVSGVEEAVNSLRTDFNAEDFASETTLDLVKTRLETEDFAQEATLSGFRNDFLAEDFSSETTLAGLRTDFNVEDFATQTTLSGIGITQTDGTQRTQITDGINELSVITNGDTISGAHGVGVMGRTEADIFRFLQVEDSGKLVVATTPPQPPAGTNEFVLAVSNSQLDVGSGGSVSSPHTTLGPIIDNGQTLALQLITVGSQGDPAEDGSRVEIIWREGAGPTDHLIERVYAQGATVTLPVPGITKARDGTVMTGNGVNTRLVVIRTRLSSAAQELDFVIRGYTE